MINASVLVLNQNFQPLNVCTAKRAVVLVDVGKAELLETGLGKIRTPMISLPVPSVIRLNNLIRRPILPKRLSRKEVFHRDRYLCLYCGSEPKRLTIDHVVPRSKGGRHVWGNVVTACMSCNHLKAGRTPKEAGMRLKAEVEAPRVTPYSFFENRPLEEQWLKFIPWLSH